MKNILIIATYFPPMGGIGVVRMTKYVKYLRKYNWNPTVVTLSEKYITNKDESLLKDIPEDVEIKRLDFKQKHGDISIDFYKALKKEVPNIVAEKEYDAILITGGPFWIIPIGKYIYKKYKIPYIVDLRDPWKLQIINNKNFISKIKGKIKRFIKGIFEKSSFKYAGAICTVNDTMTEKYKNEYPQYAQKIYTISNGFDSDDYKDIESKQLSEFTITYAGKFETSAGFRDPTNLFRVIKELNSEKKKIRFLHIGKIEPRVENIIKEEKCEEYCKCLGLKTFKETISYCKGSNILIAICGYQKIEQTGKIFDYVCCEKPIIVVSTGESEIDVVCKNFDNIYQVKHEDIEGLKEIITKKYNNEEIYKANNLENNMYSRNILTMELAKILDNMKG